MRGRTGQEGGAGGGVGRREKKGREEGEEGPEGREGRKREGDEKRTILRALSARRSETGGGRQGAGGGRPTPCPPLYDVYII